MGRLLGRLVFVLVLAVPPRVSAWGQVRPRLLFSGRVGGVGVVDKRVFFYTPSSSRGPRSSGERTLVLRIKMLHQDEAHAGVGRQPRGEGGERLERASRAPMQTIGNAPGAADSASAGVAGDKFFARGWVSVAGACAPKMGLLFQAYLPEAGDMRRLNLETDQATAECNNTESSLEQPWREFRTQPCLAPNHGGACGTAQFQ